LWGGECPHFINTLSGHHLSDVRLLTSGNNNSLKIIKFIDFFTV
jgi:hypothetical protein